MVRRSRAWIRPAIRPAHHVGIDTGDVAKQGASAADVYTYGAASEALSEGQAMQAWAELSKEQNYPKIHAVKSEGFSCPPNFLFAPDGATCVNRERLHIGPASECSSESAWMNCAELPRYVRLNERSALASGSLAKVTDATLRGMRALRMTTGAYGWKNVRSQLRAVAWMVTATPGDLADEYGEGWGPFDGPDVDEVQAALEKSIAPYYDKDAANPVAAKSAGDAIIAQLLERQRQRMRLHFAPSSGIVGTALLVGSAGALLYFLAPGLAVGAALGIWTGAKRAGSYVTTKVKGTVT